MQPPPESSFVNEICLPFLRMARNHDGGWGFYAGAESRVEATVWATLALVGTGSSEDLWRGGCKYLRTTQLPDGSWPSSRTQKTGCWATSLACWVLSQDSESQQAVTAGLRWICEDWPRDSNLIQRLIRKISSRKEVVSQNGSLRGWGWTPHTASWVEPTAFALIAFSQARQCLPSGAARRRELARDLLYDRMCPGGGWNCGNPVVYGAPGEPLVEPTVWALLALRHEPNRRENLMSLEWLARNLPHVSSPRSLALAKICWRLYGQDWPAGAITLQELYTKSEFLGNVPAVAWACLASSPDFQWLGATYREEEH